MKINKRGFSFIELIVVITIIAVLSVAAILSYGPTQRKSRDSRRVADLQKISMALEMARQIGTTYPSTLDYLVTNNFIQSIPNNPKGLEYDYDRLTDYTYEIGTSMEDPGSVNVVPPVGSINYKVFSP
ncbi:MAG: type II secretion system protein [Candidatus Shapirobacteria bacterium]|nr:type II secretion system protein [Candidatus Shapirobacteria bacterium]